MEPTSKKRSITDLFSGMGAMVQETLYDQPRAWLIEAREKVKDLPKTNFDLGCEFAEIGKWHDAWFRFKVTLYLQPNYPQALYNLGCCYYHLGKMAKARDTLKQVLREHPTHQDAIFMLAAIDPSALAPAQRPQQMPVEMVTKFFTSVATNYNQIEAQNQYRGGVAVAEVVKPFLKASAPLIVDLGCGSGIAAIPYRAEASQLIGVDMTPAMVAVASAAGTAEKKLYDRVIKADITHLGETLAADSADLVLLVNVVSYVGGLNALLASAARLLKQGGLLAISVEPSNATEGYGLASATGRFGHSAAYVKSTASGAGLSLVKESKIALYTGSNAELFIFRKGND